ncbi:FlgO family outer membrane protein [Candidatus Magnetaquicoccus inordinatus]|uniref:FlgO family outer membrane protein n=1 Tax=Candidatus Magnetaquicoccus inordinatus TaxID=2496818 RepID=UPI00102C8077|nr:FlgO family outer membrane protein [Candidatus Magnetaquicoccus inordinatus]
MMNRTATAPLRKWALLLAGALMLTGCMAQHPDYPLVSQPVGEQRHLGLEEASYLAADSLVAQSREKLKPRQTILPASFVDDKNLEQSSAMGRMLAQQVSSRLTQAGFSVVEIKLRKSVRLVKGEGEGQFLLSRELEKIAEFHNASAVLVGSYVATPSMLYVNTQLVMVKGGVVIGSQDYKIPLTRELRALLEPGT